MDENKVNDLIASAKTGNLTEEETKQLVDHVVDNRLTPTELMGGFDRPGWKMITFLGLYAALIICMFVILPLYVLITNLLVATSVVAVLKLLGLALLLGGFFLVFTSPCFLWVYEGYTYWRTKRYLADRKLRSHELTEEHFKAMTPHLATSIRSYLKSEERGRKRRLKRTINAAIDRS